VHELEIIGGMWFYKTVDPYQLLELTTMIPANLVSRSISKLSLICILSGALVLTGGYYQRAAADLNSNNRTQQVPRESKNEAIDNFTDHFFYAVNPGLNNRKLRASDKTYIQEWNAIRRAIGPLVKSSHEACVFGKRNGDAYWEFDLGDSQENNSYDYLADVIYYQRNPNMAGKKLRPNTAAAREWSAIRRELFIHVCGI
jgi:hypothetical protein